MKIVKRETLARVHTHTHTHTGNLKNKGITLIALIITIIILLILAGVAISQLTGNGLFAKVEIAKQRTRYENAKEVVNLKLMEIHVDCIAKNDDYDINKIAEEIEKAKNITIENYYNSETETASIKTGISKNMVNLKGIVVSVDEYSEYKFLIEETGKIEAVLKGEITEGTNIEDFTDIEEFETKSFGSEVATDNIEFSYEKKRIDANKKQLLIIVKDEKNGLSKIEYPDGDILNCNDKIQIAIDYTIECEVEYVFKITSNNGYVKEILIYEEPFTAIAVDYWPLNGTLNNNKVDGHGSMYSKNEVIYGNEGVYLENNYLTADIDQNCTSEWSLTCEYMPVTDYVGMAWILGFANDLDAGYTGLLYANNSLWLPHIGTVAAIKLNKLNQNQYNTIVLTYDKTNIKCYINGEYCGKGTGIKAAYKKLEVGGSRLNTPRTGGYYKNIAYYEELLYEEDNE